MSFPQRGSSRQQNKTDAQEQDRVFAWFYALLVSPDKGKTHLGGSLRTGVLPRFYPLSKPRVTGT